MEMLAIDFRSSQLTSGNKERRISPVPCCLDLNKPFFPIHVKRKNIKAKTITLCLCYMLNTVCKTCFAQLRQPPMLILDNKIFTSQA